MTRPFSISLRASLWAAPWAAVVVAAACSSPTNGTSVISQGSGSTASTGVGPSGDGSGSNAGAAGASGGIIGSAGSVATGASGAIGGSAGSIAASGSSGAGGTGAGSGSSAAGTTSGTGSAGASSGASTSGAPSGSSVGGGSGSVTTTLPHGGSAGCGLAPNGANSGGFTNHKITIPSCGDAGLSYPNCIAANFAPGGRDYLNANGEDYNHRDYSIQLPGTFNPNTPVPIFFGGGGCGGTPPQNGNGFGVGATGAIEVGLSYINGCFADGGTYCAQTPEAADCDQGPELPYFLAVLAQVEAAFCVDRGNVFVGGYSSGGWEGFTLGCGGADVVRGIVTEEGGLRNHQPACTGPVAALMVAGELDSTNPIGPLVMGMPYTPANMTVQNVNGTIQAEDSFGSAPGRDAILQRNGCTGTTTAPYDPNYPACVQYTGCPAAYPVVWCPLPGAGHNDSSYNGVNYSPGSVKNDPLMWNFLSKLPVVE